MEKTSEEEGKSGILSFHASPADSNKIFFRGTGRQHWMTTYPLQSIGGGILSVTEFKESITTCWNSNAQ